MCDAHVTISNLVSQVRKFFFRFAMSTATVAGEVAMLFHLSFPCPTSPTCFCFKLEHPSQTQVKTIRHTYRIPVWPDAALAGAVITCYSAVWPVAARSCISLLWRCLVCLPPCLALCGSAQAVSDILLGSVWGSMGLSDLPPRSVCNGSFLLPLVEPVVTLNKPPYLSLSGSLVALPVLLLYTPWRCFDSNPR